jgi:hypothetical protein
MSHPLTTRIKSQLIRCLSQIKYAGSFATFNTYLNAANPGIVIDGIGSIGLPLSERDAKAIIKISKQSPFGKGSETIIDTEVRNSWELHASQFKVENPSWGETFKEIVDRVVKELGIESEVKAVPYKMLLYEKGAMFKSHKEYACKYERQRLC